MSKIFYHCRGYVQIEAPIMSAAQHRLRQSKGWLLWSSDDRRRKIIGYGGSHMPNRKKYPHKRQLPNQPLMVASCLSCVFATIGWWCCNCPLLTDICNDACPKGAERCRTT